MAGALLDVFDVIEGFGCDHVVGRRKKERRFEESTRPHSAPEGVRIQVVTLHDSPTERR
jgi:hypothetical protein